jgi:hypothetical protein
LGLPGAITGGVVWLIAGPALIGAGLGILGLPVFREYWPGLAISGAAIAIVALAAYFHPLYLAAIAINVVLIALVWGRLGTVV